jgi:hypothetical protein
MLVPHASFAVAQERTADPWYLPEGIATAELTPISFSLLFRTDGAMRMPTHYHTDGRRQINGGSLIFPVGRQVLEQVICYDDVIHVTQTGLHLSERMKINPLTFILVQRAKELCGVPQLLQRNPQSVTVLGRKLREIATTLEDRFMPFHQKAAG